jgi:hypothetical protein
MVLLLVGEIQGSKQTKTIAAAMGVVKAQFGRTSVANQLLRDDFVDTVL